MRSLPIRAVITTKNRALQKAYQMNSVSPPVPIDEIYFEEVFVEALDSWFNADIACCDRCYERFLAAWPMAYAAEDGEFQKNQIPLDAFYDGSPRLKDHFTFEQVERLVQEIPCPRCGENLGDLLYPYEFPFEVPPDFESQIDAIGSLAQETPFLLLNNSFASDVLESIRQLAQETPAQHLKRTMFRARGLAGLSSFNVSEFDFPPSECVGEGRYNHAGAPALYLADSGETCFHELRQAVCAIAEISFHLEIKILDLVDPYESHGPDTELLNALVFSALLSTPSETKGYQKPAYVFSRFVADCARDSGFDGIRYPSTRTTEGSHNLVVWNRDLSLGRGSQIKKMSVFDGEKLRSIAL